MSEIKMSERTDVKKVKDVMTQHVYSVIPSTQFKSIARVLQAGRIGAVPVLDDSGRVVGVVSETDLLPKEGPPQALKHQSFFQSKGNRELRRKAAGLVAADLMTTPAVTVTPETSVRDAARMLVDHRVNHLPVVDAAGQQLVGIVSRSDLLSIFAGPDQSTLDEVRAQVADLTCLLDATKVDVAVEDGVVTLSGKIDRRSDARRLVARVEEIDGVVGVSDNLRYWWDDTVTRPFDHLPLG